MPSLNRTIRGWRAAAVLTVMTLVAGGIASNASLAGQQLESRAPAQLKSGGGTQTNGLPLAKPTWEKLPNSASSHPFNGDAWMWNPVGMAKHGYVEHEYLVSGPARVYDAVPNSDYEVDVINESEYTTRALVRRPKNMGKWSGNVVVEYLNATDGWGAPINWRALFPEILDQKDVYVGFMGKPNGIPILQEFDPERYADLDFPPADPATQCGDSPDDPDYDPDFSKLYENGLLWDIWSQIGRSLKSADSPLGKAAKASYAVGESQSATALYRYYKWFGGVRTTVKGEPVYDGNLAETGFSLGASPSLNQCAGPLPAADPQRRSDVIPDNGTPFFAINSQSDSPANPPPPSDHYRLWDITGADHADHVMMEWMWPSPNDQRQARLSGPDAFPWQITYGATFEAFSPSGMWCDDATGPEVGLPDAERAALVWLKKWAKNGESGAPPAPPYLTRNPDGSYVLDSDGNALGGLRLPHMEVPIARYEGVFWQPDCWNVHVPFSPERLAELYPTHGDYVAKIEDAARRAVRNGFLLSEDADDMVHRARDRAIP